MQALQARGVRSIDVGCMQVNLMHHPDAFASLEEAFDPAAERRLRGALPASLFGQTGSWPKAAAAYHSSTPDIGADYARKVLAVWGVHPATRQQEQVADGRAVASARVGPPAYAARPPTGSPW